MSFTPPSLGDEIFLPASSPLFQYSSIATPNESTGTWNGWRPANLLTNEIGQMSPGLVYETVGFANSSIFRLSNISFSAFAPYFTAPQGSLFSVTAQIDAGPSVAIVSSGNPVVANISHDNSSSQQSSAHSVTIQVDCQQGCDGQKPFVFQGGLLQTAFTSSGMATLNATLDDSSQLIDYTGYTTGTIEEHAIVPSTIVEASLQKTLTYTSTQGSNATLYFTGTAVEIIGPVGPSAGSYIVTVDGTKVAHADANNPLDKERQILSLVNGLSQGEHLLSIINEKQDCLLALDGFQVWGQNTACFGQGCTSSTTSTVSGSDNPTLTLQATATPAYTGPGYTDGEGTSAGAIVGAILGALLGIIIIVGLWRLWKTKRKEAKKAPELDAWDEANALGNQPNHFVSVKPKDKMGYMYPGQTAGTPF